jgi:hypothetical protein
MPKPNRPEPYCSDTFPSLGRDRFLNATTFPVRLQFLGRLQFVHALEKGQAGDLLNDFERIGDPAGPESVPDAINLIANFTSKHRCRSKLQPDHGPQLMSVASAGNVWRHVALNRRQRDYGGRKQNYRTGVHGERGFCLTVTITIQRYLPYTRRLSINNFGDPFPIL